MTDAQPDTQTQPSALVDPHCASTRRDKASEAQSNVRDDRARDADKQTIAILRTVAQPVSALVTRASAVVLHADVIELGDGGSSEVVAVADGRAASAGCIGEGSL